MGSWFLILACIVLATVSRSILFRHKKLPPGPLFLFSHLLLLTNSLPNFQFIIRGLKSKYGPIITLNIGSSSFSLCREPFSEPPSPHPERHHLLRPPSNLASYGPIWRTYRHNLGSNFLHPSNVKSYSWARKRVMGIMMNRLQEQQEAVGSVKVVDHIELAMLRLSLLMCFGDKVEERLVNVIACVQDGLLSLAGSWRFNVFLVSRWLLKMLFRNTWKKFNQLRMDQKQLIISLIRSRTERATKLGDKKQMVAYVDTLVKTTGVGSA